MVRVAAVQCPSGMGKVAQNRERLTRLITAAAQHGAKIVVLPECALSGYMDLSQNILWDKRPGGDSENFDVRLAAERIPGKSTKYFGALARELQIYLTVPLIEVDHESFYNAVVLLGPSGQILARHRKYNLWPPGDGSWASAGGGAPQVVATPYGMLGLMICYDVHVMAARLKSKADIVLYSVGWYGPNSDGWFGETFPARYVKPNGFAVVAANWSAESTDDAWSGAGFSSIFDHQGNLLAMSKRTDGEEILYADLPIEHAAKSADSTVHVMPDVSDEE